jgi:hypothetical protein
MKVKILLIVVLLFFQMQFIFSQCISIELSVTWKMGSDIFKEDSSVNIPQLHITYRNITDTNYYFLKVSDSRNGLPMTPYAGSLHPANCYDYFRWHNDYLGRAKSHNIYTNQNFHVQIGGMPLFSEGWFVVSDSLYFGEEQEFEIDFINSNLSDIYEYMYRSNNSEYVVKKLYFTSSDVTPENISGAVKDQFVFLKPCETYIDTYNLTGFKLVEGCFTFMINQNSIKDYVLIDPIWDSNLSYWNEQRMELPLIVGEYELFTGYFLTNQVRVSFPGIKEKE